VWHFFIFKNSSSSETLPQFISIFDIDKVLNFPTGHRAWSYILSITISVARKRITITFITYFECKLLGQILCIICKTHVSSGNYTSQSRVISFWTISSGSIFDIDWSPSWDFAINMSWNVSQVQTMFHVIFMTLKNIHKWCSWKMINIIIWN